MGHRSDHEAYRILLVEDEPHLLELYQKELEDEGFQVITTADGDQAIDLAKRVLPNLVVLDIKINKVLGLEVLREIKTFDQKIPVILNSAYATFRADFSSWMADAYIVKSSDLTELKRSITKLLNLD
jgi:two-component system response regulator (stage 0 sporulation protein F)